MSSIIGIVIAIVGLGFLILAHEFGHYIVAKAVGMRVEEFSIGFGRYLISRRVRGTVYGISALPLGGYVRVTGMHREDFEARVREAREEAAIDHVFSDDWDEADEETEVEEEAARRPVDPEDRLTGARALTAAEVAST
ncbi:MAG: site-2 protease family protein, partial [bacterium]